MPDRRFLCAVLALSLSGPGWAEHPFDPGWAPFVASVYSGSEPTTVAYRELALFYLPDEPIILRIDDARAGEYRVSVDGEHLLEEAPGGWRWRLPAEPGLQRAKLTHRDGGTMRLNLFAKRALEEVEEGKLNGYRIGHYPSPEEGGSGIYAAPQGLVEVTPELASVQVSPHFTLGQFLCRQQPEHWPKYLVLQPPLVLKLELLLEEMNRRGVRTDSLHVTSGYRTPWYNRSLGLVAFSRHVWGAAADIVIDSAGDGRMDDLTGNGKSGMAEARLVQQIVEERFADPPSPQMVGGLGLYGPRPYRGPFIHVDVRDQAVVWESP